MNVVERLRADWEQRQAAGIGKVDGKPYGWEWGEDDILLDMAALCKGHVRGHVVEVGCGGGRWTRWLFEQGAEAVTAVDIHQTALDQAAAYEPRATYLLGNGETIPVPDGSADVVWFWDVLLHLPQTLALQYLCEAARVSRGVAIFGLPDLTTDRARSEFCRATSWAGWREPFGLGYMEFYTPETAKMLCWMAGMDYWLLGHIGRPVRDMVVEARP